MPIPKSASAPDQIRVQAWLPRALYEPLSKMAEDAARPVAAEVRLALKAWVENTDKRTGS